LYRGWTRLTNGYYLMCSTGEQRWSYGVQVDWTDSLGNHFGTRFYRDTWDIYGEDIAATTDGGFVVLGTRMFWPSDAVQLIKVGTDLQMEWSASYDEAFTQSPVRVHQLSDGGFIVVGTTNWPFGVNDLLLIRYDAFGDTLWARGYGSPDVTETGADVLELDDGGFVAVGSRVTSSPSLTNVFIVRTDSIGDTLWTRMWNWPGEGAEGFAIATTPEGNYVIAGEAYIDHPWFGEGLLLCYSTDGQPLFYETYSTGTNYTYFKSVTALPDFSFVLAGTSYSDESGEDFYVVRTTAPHFGLSYPAWHDTLLVDSTLYINWVTGQVGGDVLIALNREFPNGEWETLTASTPNDGSFAWTVTGPETEHARVRIEPLADPTLADTTDGDIWITHPHLFILYPSAADTEWTGRRDTIQVDRIAIPENVLVEITRDYPNGDWDTLITSTPLSRIPWTIRKPIGEHCRLRITSVTHPQVTALSDTDFVIVAPQISMISPNGGEQLLLGEEFDILWSAPEHVGRVNIILDRDYPNGLWSVITTNTDNDGVYTWSPHPVTQHARIRIMTQWDPQSYGESAADFAIITDAATEPGPLPTAFALGEPYPNPFNASTTLKIAVPRAAELSLVLYDITGRVALEFPRAHYEAGWHTIRVDGTGLASGVYFAQLRSDGVLATQKLLLLK
jgi:hypothetical protein